MSQLLRVHNFLVSADGFGSGEGQSLERPFGHADPADLASWAAATASWPNRSEPGGTRGLDDHFTREFSRNIGAEIMGRGTFGPQSGPWEDLSWQGWWGDEPPFRTPVFVLTHHLRPSFALGQTTFHFLDATPAAALNRARAAGSRRCGRSSTPASSTRSTSRSHRCGSAGADGSGTHRRTWATATTTRACRASAGWCTTSTGGADSAPSPGRRRRQAAGEGQRGGIVG